MPHGGSAPPAFVSPRLRSRTLQGSASPTARDSFSEGNIPHFRARVTFGRSPKSDQKVCLKPQVSRLPARLTMLKNMAAYPAKAKIYADRRTTNRLYVSPRCRSHAPRGDAAVCYRAAGLLRPYRRFPEYRRTQIDAPRRGRRPRRPAHVSAMSPAGRVPRCAGTFPAPR